MTAHARLDQLDKVVREIYRDRAALVPYHGWQHVDFVVRKSQTFAPDLDADLTLTLAAAHVHDFNYLVDGGSTENAGRELRAKVLGQVGFSIAAAERVESIILEARTGARHADISPEAKALSDADTAYKTLPTTPLLTVHYLTETGRTLRQLATKIVTEQTPLREGGIYFYSARANEAYGEWAQSNLQLWTRVLSSLDEPDIAEVLALMRT